MNSIVNQQAVSLSRRDSLDEHLFPIADAIPASILYFDGVESCRFANATWRHRFGQPGRCPSGQSAKELLGEAYNVIQPFLSAALSGKMARSDKTVTIREAEGLIEAIVVCCPDTSDDGNVRGITLLLLESGKTQISLEKETGSPSQRLPADSSPVFIARFDSDSRLRFIEKTESGRLAGASEESVGLRISDIMGEDAFRILRRYVDAALTEGPKGPTQGRAAMKRHEPAIRSDMNSATQALTEEVGAASPVFSSSAAVSSSDIDNLVAAISDITRLRRTEEKLHRREQEFKTLVENSPDIIVRFDRDMRHLYVNPAVEATFGVPASAYLGKTKAQIGLPADVVAAWDAATVKVFASCTEQQFEFTQCIDSKVRHFTTRLIPEFDRDGNIESLLGITYDVTERTRMEKEREVLLERERTARIQAETAARARDEFLAIVSHELRAPLNGIQSWAHVLESYTQDSATVGVAQRALQGIRTGVAQQVRLIEDLLDVTRMMSGKLRLVRQPFTMLPVLQSAVQSVRDLASAKRIGITSTYNITAEQVDGDPDRVQQIVWNLLSNAIKFTPEDGSVWLTATANESVISITVSDNGMGIAPDFLPNLFDRFSQKDTSSTRGHGGLGLGLFLVRYLVELHGGAVSVKSGGEAKGATFLVQLPLRAGSGSYLDMADAEDIARTEALPSLNGLHVLLVDDQADAREALSIVLRNAGAVVHSAESAKEAVSTLSSLENDCMPDMLICDIAMPDEDGYAALRRIRGWKARDGKKPLARLPAIALTAFSQREDRIRALTAGFQMHITKPVAPEELIVVIDTMAARELE